jgi:hypothetical protein
MDDLREDLKDQRDKLMFHIEQVNRHLSGLESGALQIINGSANLPAAELRVVTKLYIDHFASEIDTMAEMIIFLDHQREHMDGEDDEPYRSFRCGNAYRRLKRLYLD